MAPRVYLIILNWNGQQDTLACLVSTQSIDYPALNIVVVDNGSRDDSVNAIQVAFPEVTVLETGANLGYAGGNNVGIRHALAQGAEYVFVLNNDTTVAPDIIRQFLRVAQSKPDAAFISPRIYEADRPNTIYYDGGMWDWQTQCVRLLGKGNEDIGQAGVSARETEIIHGCAVFFPVTTMSRIGLIDERFFLLFEETDWSFRAREAGLRNYVAPAAKVWHKGAASFGGRDTPLRHYFHTRNYLLWGERHLGRAAFYRLLAGRIFQDLFKFSQATVNLSLADNMRRIYWNWRRALSSWQGRRSDPQFYAKWLGLRDYFLRRFGDCPAEVRSL